MSVKSFKFISPGIFINEIDNSQLPALPDEVGPVVIGRTERGPGMRPVKVNSFSEYVQVFGNPIPGGSGDDVWRNGNYTAPTYAAYAAQAYLRNSSALTVVRLLGGQSSQVADGGAGEAGWQVSGSNDLDPGVNGGAYGLFLFPSASAVTPVTGVLAAQWYLDEGSIELSGTVRASTTIATGSAVLFKDLSSSGVAGAATVEYKVLIKDKDGTLVKETAFDFTRSSSKYLRKVFNTNPTLINTAITRTAQKETYWLGPSYEREVADNITGASHAVILGLDSGSNNAANFRFGFRAAQSPWIISQDLQSVSTGFVADSMTKLFKFHTLDSGDDQQRRVKISITDVKASSNEIDPYGSFSVEVRDVKDNDNAPVVLERYSSVNLNPNHPKYIARVIGDQHIVWDDQERRYRTYGNFVNRSSIIRLEMNEDVDAAATDARLLPFGSFGPIRFKNWGKTSAPILSSSDTPPDTYVTGASGIAHPFRHGVLNPFWFVEAGITTQGRFTGTVDYPALPLRVSSSDGDIADPTNAYFGIDSTQNGNNRFESSYIDIVRALPNSANNFTVGAGTEFSYVFTLDDLKSSNSGDTGEIAVYSSGSRNAGTSFSAVSGTYEQVLDMGYDRFTVPLVGGFDGLDVRDKEPFNNTDLDGGSDTSNYAFYSVRRAIDTIADPENVEMNILTLPGIFNSALTSKVLEICENRGDALGIIDIDSGYKPQTENTSTQQQNAGTVATAVSNLSARQLNSSYGACYYPWVQIQDTVTSNSRLWVPPSVVALGTFASSAAQTEVWFAPAGFNRGGLSQGSAGIPVLNVSQRLTSKDRDALYDANINPIASFPNEGIVIFGQKTLQLTPSALDRINVRRMMIFVKRQISIFANSILFDQNVEVTWNRFKSLAVPFLASVQTRLGLSDYKLILDKTTTTPDLVDRNIVYAKIFLKPAKAIEYIALDFVITNQGAAFED